jgi:hypothetical protein
VTASGGEWLTGTPVLLVAGTGGVGSTTVTAAIGFAAASRGADVLLVPMGDRPALPALLGVGEVDGRDRDVLRPPSGGRLRVRRVAPLDGVADVLALGGVRGVVRRAAMAGALPLISAAAPGLADLLTLAHVGDLAARRVAEVIVVAAPPAGQAEPLLEAVAEMPAVVRSADVRRRAEDVRELLSDRDRAGVVLVTTPSRDAVEGTCRLLDRVRSDLRAITGPVVVNRWRELVAERSAAEWSPREAARLDGVSLSPAAAAALDGAVLTVRRRTQGLEARLARVRDASGRAPVLLPELGRRPGSPSDLAPLAGALRGETDSTVGVG